MPERTELALRVEGALDGASEAALTSVVEAELAPLGVRSSVVRGHGPVADWLALRARDAGVLVVAVLDVRDPGAWELILVDAARGRAIRRKLSFGLATDAAAYEAVASVLAAAAAALKDGLEVASRPLAEIAPPEASTREPERPAHTVKPAPQRSESAKANPRLFADLGAGVLSLSPDVPVSAAFSAALGVRMKYGLGVRARGAGSLPAPIATELGRFELGSRTLELSLGIAQRFGLLVLEPTLGLRAELLLRSNGAAANGAHGRGDDSAWRLGPAASARLRLPLLRWVALELSGHAAYSPRDIRYVAEQAGTPAPVELARLSHFSLGAELGLSIQPAP